MRVGGQHGGPLLSRGARRAFAPLSRLLFEFGAAVEPVCLERLVGSGHAGVMQFGHQLTDLVIRFTGDAPCDDCCDFGVGPADGALADLDWHREQASMDIAVNRRVTGKPSLRKYGAHSQDRHFQNLLSPSGA